MKTRNVPKYRENPFLSEVAENIQTRYKKIAVKNNESLAIINKDTGELHGAAGFWYKEETEKERFVKLYADGVAGIMGLKNPGKKVFRLLYNQLLGHKDRTEISLYYDSLSDDEKKGLGKRTFVSGITELINARFIAESIIPARYFINPAFIYNGDRLAIIKEFVLKKDDKPQEKIENQDEPMDLFELEGKPAK